MALKVLENNDQSSKITARMAEIAVELNNINKEELELIKRLKELDETNNDVAIKELYDLSTDLETRKEKIENEKLDLIEKQKTLKNEIQKSIEGEKMEKEVKNQELETRSILNDYYHTKKMDVVRDAGFTSEDGDVLIPEEIIYQPRDEVYTESDLEQYVNRVSVSVPSGRYPIMKRTSEVMHTVAELAKNPELGNPKFEDVNFDVETYRGYIPVSQEAIDDSAVDLLGLITRHILRIKLNTTNKEIAPILKSFKPVIAKNIDAIKKVKNTMLDPAYQITYYMSQTMYDYIDTMKDKNGHYLFQDDISSPSGKRLFGSNVVVLRDNLIGDYNGHMACFMGDSKAGVTEFDRKQISARWVDSDIYGEKIQMGFRADFQKVDSDAGYYVTLAPAELDIKLTTSDETQPETVEGVSATIEVADNKAVIKYTGLTGQVITYQLLDAKNAVVAEMVGRFTSEKTEDQITITFDQNMVKGNYTLNAKVLDQKKYKTIEQVKLSIKLKSDEVAKTFTSSPIVIGS